MSGWTRRGDREGTHGFGRRTLKIAAIGLVLVGILLTAFEFVLLQREFERSAQILARVTAIHSAAPVVFSDAMGLRPQTGGSMR